MSSISPARCLETCRSQVDGWSAGLTPLFRFWGRSLWLGVFLYYITPVHYPGKGFWLVLLGIGSSVMALLPALRRVPLSDRLSARFRRLLTVLALALLWATVAAALVKTLPILLSFQPLLSLALAAVVGLLGIAAWRKPSLRRVVNWFTPVWSYQLLLVAVLFVHFSGSSGATCQQIGRNPKVLALLSQKTLFGLESVGPVFPYDSAYDPTRGLFVVSLKEQRAGYFNVLDPAGEASSALAVVDGTDGRILALHPLPNRDAVSYPQNLVIDPELGVAAVYFVSREFLHSVATFRYSRRSLERLTTRTFEPYEEGAQGNIGEPDGILRLEGTHEIVVNTYGGGGAWLWTATLPNLTDERFVRVDSRFKLLDKTSHDAARGRILVASHTGKVLVLDDETLTVSKAISTLDPVTAVDFHPDTGDFFATGVLFGELLHIDGETLEVVERVSTVGTPRSLAIDANRGLLFVAGYVTGEVAVHDLSTLKRLDTVKVGRVARSLHRLPGTGSLTVCSSCGLLELTGDWGQGEEP